MDDTDIRDLFSPFGDIKQLHLTKDDVTSENKGNAFIEYNYGWKRIFISVKRPLFGGFFYRRVKSFQLFERQEKEAADAVKSMNLFELCGQKLRVGKAISPPFSIGEKKVERIFFLACSNNFQELGEIKTVIPKLARPRK